MSIAGISLDRCKLARFWRDYENAQTEQLIITQNNTNTNLADKHHINHADRNLKKSTQIAEIHLRRRKHIIFLRYWA